MKLHRILPLVAGAAVVLNCEAPRSTDLRTAAPAFDRSSASGLSIACADKPGNHLARRPNAPLALECALTLPPGSGSIVNGTKFWAEGGRFYLTELGNASVYVYDAISHASLGRITGFVGAVLNANGTVNAAVSGPNSITFSEDGHAWVSDGNSNVRVVDLSTMSIIRTISTAIGACDNGTLHRCQRTNEITYDPDHHLIFVQNPSPLSLTGTTGTPIDTYGTFIDANTYAVVGTITFPDRQNQEAPLWDPDQHRILTAVGGRQVVANGVVTQVFDQFVAVIDPGVRPFAVERHYTIDCTALGLTTPITAANPSGRLFGVNDPSLAPGGKMVIPACGRAVLMDAVSGAVTGVAPVGGGNETWYNPGDGNFYVTGAQFTDLSITPSGPNSLGVINAATGTLLQYVPAVGATNPASAEQNNNVVAVVPGNTTNTTTACTAFNAQVSGCILVFAHVPGGGN